MELHNQYCFRAGFALAVSRIRAGDTDASWTQAVRENHTAPFVDGYVAALDHHRGFDTHGTALARRMGLCAHYRDVVLAGYNEPAELPGHCLPL